MLLLVWATFTEVEEKERSYRTRCNVANRNSRLFAHINSNGKYMNRRFSEGKMTYTYEPKQ